MLQFSQSKELRAILIFLKFQDKELLATFYITHETLCIASSMKPENWHWDLQK